jgi:hypothetical protein
MRLSIVILCLLAALSAWAAAPPAQPRNLTPQEEKELAALSARLNRHDDAGEFEQSAKVAQQIAQYRRQRQGTATGKPSMRASRWTSGVDWQRCPRRIEPRSCAP